MSKKLDFPDKKCYGTDQPSDFCLSVEKGGCRFLKINKFSNVKVCKLKMQYLLKGLELKEKVETIKETKKRIYDKCKSPNLKNSLQEKPEKCTIYDNEELTIDVEFCRFLLDEGSGNCGHPNFKGKQVICGFMVLKDCELAEDKREGKDKV